LYANNYKYVSLCSLKYRLSPVYRPETKDRGTRSNTSSGDSLRRFRGDAVANSHIYITYIYFSYRLHIYMLDFIVHMHYYVT